MKNIKPRKLGVLHRTFMVAGRTSLVVSPLCFFELGSGRVIDETEGWKKVAPRLGSDGCLDPVFPKHNAEVLLAGSAWAPRGTRVTEAIVGLKVGTVDKRLRVWGDRNAVRGLLPTSRVSAPQPFEQMPLVPSRAFGGPDYAPNPDGTGHQTLRGRLTESEVKLPNIEPLRSSDPEPAGFGPLPMGSPARRGHAGTYDTAWANNDFPGFPGDVQRLLFNAAPVDQQQLERWAGDESLELRGMHPDLPLIEGRLPGVAARAFVRRTAEDLREVPLRAETLWLFPYLDLTDLGLGDSGLGVVIFRGETPIDDDDADDVESVLVAYEGLHDPPRPLAHYRRVVELSTGDAKQRLAHVLDDGPLSPQVSPAVEAEREAEREQALKEYYASAAAVSEAVLEENPQIAELEGYTPPTCPPPKLGVISKQALARGDFDLTETLDKAEAWEQEARDKAAELEAEAAEAMAKLPPGQAELDPGSPKVVAQAVAKRVATALQQPREFGGEGLASRGEVPEIPDAALDDPALASLLQRAGDLQTPSVEQLQDDTRGRRATVEPKPIEAAHREAIGLALRRTVRELLAGGHSMAGRDLAGADLRGMSFDSVDLRQVLLEHADLRDAKFSACRFDGATLAAARLDGASVVNCTLSNANLCGARGAGTSFHACELSEGLWLGSEWHDAEFTNCGWSRVIANEMEALRCRFDGSRFDETFFVEADLSGSSFADCRGARTLLVHAKLVAARLDGSSWSRCLAAGLDATDSRWDHTTLDRVQFAGGQSTLAGASFRGVLAKQVGFRGTPLGNARLQGSVFESCDFGDVELRGADLSDSSFEGSLLTRATLAECDLGGTTFYQALLNKAKLVGCKVGAANFYGANCQGAVFEGIGDTQLRGLSAAAVQVSR